MNKNRIYIGFIAGSCLCLLLLVAMSLGSMDLEKEVLNEMVLTCGEEGQALDFRLWRDGKSNRYYLFLPSWFSGETAEFSVTYGGWPARVEIDGMACGEGSRWVDEGKEEVHSLDVYGVMGAEPVHATLQALRSENLPAIFVDVEEKNRIISEEDSPEKKYFETGYMQMLDEEGELVCQSRLEKFKVRGNLTATFDKKPFTFTMEKPAELLGMEPAVKWNLLADASDGTHIRNKIIRDLACDCIGTYEPQGEYTEVYLNGEYQGLYLLTEAVEIGPNRIEIDPDANWFIEMELDYRAREDDTRMMTKRGETFIIHSDKEVTKEEKEQLLGRLNDVESALFAENGVSQISGKPLEELIDLESFAKAWLVEELSGDHDMGITSQFAYAKKEGDSLWYAGPTWDFDGAMGNVHTPMYAVPEVLIGSVEITRVEEENNQNRWLSAMWRNPKFQELVKKKYTEVFRKEYKRILEQEIDEYVRTIRRSMVLDTFRWHKGRFFWLFILPEGADKQEERESYEEYDTFDECLEVVVDFMTRKLAFLDKLWIEGREFCILELRNSAPFLDQGYNQTLYYWVEVGTPVENLPCYEAEGWRFEGYFDKDYGDLICDGFVMEYSRIAEGRWTQVEEE